MLLIKLVERISKMINKELKNLKVIQYLNKGSTQYSLFPTLKLISFRLTNVEITNAEPGQDVHLKTNSPHK